MDFLSIKLISLIVIILSLSCCQREINCDQDNNISNCFSFDKKNNYDDKNQYITKKGKLYFFKKDSKNKHFKSLDLRVANIINQQLNIFFKNPPDHLTAQYNYRMVLDDSLVYDITNIQMKVDTAGRTMGGWAIGCKVMSIEVNGKTYIPDRYFDSLNFPFDCALKIR
ncbi:hypothetical protein C4F50_04730 [Flavobacterium sp. KB82]|uniref:Lipoprotein n=2 Tax=Flavobacterium hungaricum TaxID=2082725 RepID=A0ABR9TFW1_9FLAO|nr:hypothetical protein [Flavobacterium hungaricum]